MSKFQLSKDSYVFTRKKAKITYKKHKLPTESVNKCKLHLKSVRIKKLGPKNCKLRKKKFYTIERRSCDLKSTFLKSVATMFVVPVIARHTIQTADGVELAHAIVALIVATVVTFYAVYIAWKSFKFFQGLLKFSKVAFTYAIIIFKIQH